LNLDGNSYALVPFDSSVSPQGVSFTMEYWVYPRNNGVIFSKGVNSGEGFFSIRYQDKSNAGIDSRVDIGNSVAELELLKWTHVVSTYDSSNDTWSYYHNGVFDSSYVDANGDFGEINNSDLAIGRWVYASLEWLEGQLGDLRLYKGKALTAAEVQAHYYLERKKYSTI